MMAGMLHNLTNPALVGASMSVLVPYMCGEIENPLRIFALSTGISFAGRFVYELLFPGGDCVFRRALATMGVAMAMEWMPVASLKLPVCPGNLYYFIFALPSAQIVVDVAMKGVMEGPMAAKRALYLA